jgi:hypothetical protein
VIIFYDVSPTDSKIVLSMLSNKSQLAVWMLNAVVIDEVNKSHWEQIYIDEKDISEKDVLDGESATIDGDFYKIVSDDGKSYVSVGEPGTVVDIQARGWRWDGKIKSPKLDNKQVPKNLKINEA